MPLTRRSSAPSQSWSKLASLTVHGRLMCGVDHQQLWKDEAAAAEGPSNPALQGSSSRLSRSWPSHLDHFGLAFFAQIGESASRAVPASEDGPKVLR